MYTRQQAEKLHQMIKDGETEAAQKFINGLGDRQKDLCCLEVPRNGTSLHVAAKTGNTTILSQLLDIGVPVDIRTSEANNVFGLTSLHVAAKCGQLDAVDLLVKKGACVNAREADGQSPLLMACIHSKTEIVEYLVDNGADVNIPDNSGQYPILTSILRGPNEISFMLISHGANVHVTDKEGQTALHYACEWDNYDLVEYLLKDKANPNTKDRDGRTPLHIAASDVVFDLLVSYGGDTTSRDRNGKPPREAPLDLEKEEYQNINKALSKHHDLAEKRVMHPKVADHERTVRVFSPGPPIPEAELKAAKTSMLQELQRRGGGSKVNPKLTKPEQLASTLADTRIQ